MYKRILTVQDISCVGQCSLTVALPILSACGLETCIIPSAVLSTHTYGFKGYTFCDLTDEIEPIMNHWIGENIKFDAIYTGYLGSTRQIALVEKLFANVGAGGFCKIVDPAMADNGKLYTGFDTEFVGEMKKLCGSADIILPNITEAALMCKIEYRENYDEAYVERLCGALTDAGAKTVVLTGVGYTPDTTGVVVFGGGKLEYYCHKKISKGCHGTGDVFASAFTGAYMQGKSLYDSAKIAADYTVACIENTISDSSHWYGVKFEPLLGELAKKVSEKTND